jgi:hypothetical protein
MNSALNDVFHSAHATRADASGTKRRKNVANPPRPGAVVPPRKKFLRESAFICVIREPSYALIFILTPFSC